MFKKFILGLGLLGVVSSANAACSYQASQGEYVWNFNSNTVNFTLNIGQVKRVSDIIPTNTLNAALVNNIKLYALPDCSLVLSDAIIRNGPKNNAIIIPGDTIGFGTHIWETPNGDSANILTYLTFRNLNAVAASTSNPEVDALKAKVQALESKVYSCVQ